MNVIIFCFQKIRLELDGLFIFATPTQIELIHDLLQLMLGSKTGAFYNYHKIFIIFSWARKVALFCYIFLR